MRFSILVFNSNQDSMAVGLPLKICEIFFAHRAWKSSFAQICNFRPLADERPTTSTQSIHRFKVGRRPIFIGHCGLQFCRWQYGYGSIFIRL